MKIDLKVNEPSLCVGDLKLGDVFQVKDYGISYYMIVKLFTPHVVPTDCSYEGCTVLCLDDNEVMKLRSNLPVVVFHDAVITNKGK